MRSPIRLLSILAAAMCLAGSVLASPIAWPTKPVTLLVPFPAGGTVDIIARTIGQRLGMEVGQSFIVENHGGAGGTIGTGLLARAAPDGQTLLFNHIGLVFNAALYDHLPYDTMRDIAPVAYIGATPNVLVVTNSLPVKNVQEFLALARAKPGTINYGSGGVGSAGHLAMELLEQDTGIKLQHVPYKGNGPAIVDLISGQIQAILATIPAVMPYIKSGQMRAIATSGSRRSPALPDLPTFAEAGVKGFDYAPWYAVFAPGGTPPEVLQKIHDSIDAILADPKVVAELGRQGLEVRRMTREQFAEIVHSDFSKWAGLIKTLNIKPE